MAAEGALWPTPATIGSVTAPSSGRFIRIHLMVARGFSAWLGPLPPWSMSLLAPSHSAGLDLPPSSS